MNQKEKLIKIASFLLFIMLALIIGIHHEPWTDEAQSWLIARDVSLNDLFSVMAYEGSPALWQIILKIFIFFGLTYQYLFVVPLLFSALGVWLLIFKTKIPLGIRVALPFTYYIFYQYTIVARSYCLVLPCMELIVLTYKDRLKKPYFYGPLLILLSGVCVHTMLLSGVLFLFFCRDILGMIKRKESRSSIARNLAAASAVGISYLFTVFSLRTPADCSFRASFNLNIKSVLFCFLTRFGQALVFNRLTIPIILATVVLLAITSVILACYYRTNFKFLLTASAIWVFLSCFYCNKWHIGLIFLSFIFALQLFPPEPKFADSRTQNCIYILVGIVLCLQIGWSVRTASYDFLESNSGAREAAEFIKENGYAEEEIYGLGYCSTAIEPYFDRNIFKNRGKDTAYYIWSTSNGDMTNEEILNHLPQVTVYSEFEQSHVQCVINALKGLGYKCYSFEGATYIKDSIYESQTYYVFVRP